MTANNICYEKLYNWTNFETIKEVINLFKRSGLLLLAAMLFISTLAVPAWGADNISLNDSLQEIVSYYENNKTTLDNWEEVVGLANAGVNFSDNSWQLPDWGIDSLNEASPGAKYATTILGMLAANQDPTIVNDRNLVNELAARQTDNGAFGEQITDTIWAMVALDKAQAPYDIEKAVNYLMTQQITDGGFAFSGSTADPDITGFALIALSSHTDTAEVNESINAAKVSLQKMQLDNGGFASWGTENTETIAAVIRGLVACGEDITADPWVKNGKTMIDAIYAFQLEDKSFSHTIAGNHNDMATRQALSAVADMVNANIDYQIGQNQSGGGDSDEATVRVRVEGSANLKDEVVTVAGKALDALKAAVGENNIQLDSHGMIANILEESGHKDIAEGIDSSWMYYVIRESNIEPTAFSEGPGSYNIQDGDEIVFYLGAYDNATWEAKTYFPVISVSPETPSAGQSLIINISAQNYNYTTGLEDLDQDTTEAIGSYTVKVGGTEYSSFFGQVTIPDVPAGVLTYTISNSNAAGYADVVTYAGSIEVGEAVDCKVRVRVEGAATNLKDEIVTVQGTAFDALKAAVGENNVQLDQYGMVGTILEESGQKNVADGTDTSWMYYVIREGTTDATAFSTGSNSYNIKNGDHIVFYIGAYDNATWDAKTYFPVVSVSPSQPTSGQNIVLTITAQKNIWGVLHDLSAEEVTSIGDYIVKVGANEYHSSDGKVTIPGASAGIIQYSITNPNEMGYPDVITYTGNLEIKASGGGGSGVGNSITVSIAVVGKEGNLLYRPGSVQISKNDEFGLTAMSALEATRLSYEFSNRNDGMVVSIAGQSNEGMNGWCGKVNNSSFWDVPKEIPVAQGDKIIFWYSLDANFDGPEWDDLLSGKTGQTSSNLPHLYNEKVKETLNSCNEELNNLLKEVDSKTGTSTSKVLNVSAKMTQTKAQALLKELADNKVDISATAGRTEAVLGDKEVSMLVPENALSQTKNLTIQELDSNQEYALGIKLGSSIYEFGPAGTKFDKPVTISITVPITEDLDTNNLTPAWYDAESQKWIPIPAVIDLETGLVVFRIDHFTKFAVIQKPEVIKVPEVIAVSNRITFTDVNADMAWAQDAIEILAGKGIIKGTGQGLFEPQRPISRSEFVQMMVTALQLKTETYKEGLFNDVYASNWFAAAVATAYHHQIVSGYPDGSFKPGHSISRNEIASIFYQIEGRKNSSTVMLMYDDLEEIPVWALNGVRFTYEYGLMSGYEDGTFRGEKPLTRAEAAVVIYKYVNSSAKL